MLKKLTQAMEAVLLDYMGRIKEVLEYSYSDSDIVACTEARRRYEVEGIEVLWIGNAGGSGKMRLIVFEGKAQPEEHVHANAH